MLQKSGGECMQCKTNAMAAPQSTCGDSVRRFGFLDRKCKILILLESMLLLKGIKMFPADQRPPLTGSEQNFSFVSARNSTCGL